MAGPKSSADVPARPSGEPPLPAPSLPALPKLPAPQAPSVPQDAPRSGVLHVRHRHTERYTVVGNHLAQHPRLSAVAIGIGVHIQSLPDGATVTIKALSVRFPEGEVTIGRAIRELETAGYLARRRVPLGGGRIATRTFFLDHPGAGSGAGAGAAAGAAGAAAVQAPVRAPVRARRTRTAVTTPAPAPSEAPPPAPPPPPPPPPSPVRTKRTAPEPAPVSPAPEGPAADLLARLRVADKRLLLSEDDVHRLAPVVETWLTRAATPEQITRSLTTGLPIDATPINHPARFVEHRLTTLRPPPLPPEPLTPTKGFTPLPRVPLVTCDDCDRAFRSSDPHALCRDCRERRTHRERGGAEWAHAAACA
ncbi:hypothetical protein GBW32_15535 [Streptomyces tsukubensis]|nr:hypothetical protein GBW32_15535 [Streptomyces tsukubensis]